MEQTIPPERVGLNGEYDHQGMAKRARRTLNQSFPMAEIAHLSISQRGRVLVLQGRISNQALLDRLLNTLVLVNGVEAIEIRQQVAIAECPGYQPARESPIGQHRNGTVSYNYD